MSLAFFLVFLCIFQSEFLFHLSLQIFTQQCAIRSLSRISSTYNVSKFLLCTVFDGTFINYNQSLQSCGIIVSFTFLVLFFGSSNSEPYSDLWFPKSYIGTWWQFLSQQSIFCWRMIKNVCRCNTSIKNTVIFLLEGHSIVLAYFNNVIFSMFYNQCWFLR